MVPAFAVPLPADWPGQRLTLVHNREPVTGVTPFRVSNSVCGAKSASSPVIRMERSPVPAAVSAALDEDTCTVSAAPVGNPAYRPPPAQMSSGAAVASTSALYPNFETYS
jgi:hypothetical protein